MILNTKLSEKDMNSSDLETPGKQENTVLCLDSGLIGFPDFSRAEMVYRQDELPFLHLRELAEDGIEFIVLEPYGFFSDYQVEINDEDLKALAIEDSSEVHLFNIVTLSAESNASTVNLVAPIVFNKRTLQGKQVIIGNANMYSSAHPVIQVTCSQKIE